MQLLLDPMSKVTPLAKLILDRKDEQDWSFEDIAERGGLDRTTIHKLATKETFDQPPRSKTLKALAKGLLLPESVVREAAAQSAGYKVYDETSDQGMRVLIGNLERLTDEQREVIAATVDSMLRRKPTKRGRARG